MQYPMIFLPWSLLWFRRAPLYEVRPEADPADTPTLEGVFFLLSLRLAGAKAGSPRELPPAVIAVWQLAAQQGAVWGVA